MREDSLSTILIAPQLSLKTLRCNRSLIGQLILREVEVQYRGSYLGLVWMFARPLLMLSVYVVVFGVVWPHDGDDVPLGTFAMEMFCGLSVYNLFATSLTHSCTSIVGNVGFVKQVVFPLSTLPFAKTISQHVLGLAWFLLLYVGVFLVYHALPLTCLLLPVVILPLFLLTMGICWFVASLTVYIRDLRMFIPVVLQVLFFLTPIFWQLDRLKGKQAYLVRFLYLNPLTIVVEAARDVVIRGVVPDCRLLGILTLVGLLSWYLGFAWFEKTKKGFADVI